MAGKSDDVKVAIALAGDTVRLIDDAGTRLVGRLEAGARDSIVADEALLRGQAPGSTKEKRRDAGEATQSERATSRTASDKLSILRQQINDAQLDPETAAAWGRGMTLRADHNASVLALGRKIVRRARAKPAEMRAIGLESSDIDHLEALLDAITPADARQGTKRDESKAATGREAAAIKRIYATVRKVASAAVSEFSPNPMRDAARPPDAAVVGRALGLRERATPPTVRAKTKKREPAK